MRLKDTFFSKKHTLNFHGKLFSSDTPIVMGILNVTPDSFFDGGQYTQTDQILKRCDTILEEGAAIVDIGAYSSRPGAKHISEIEELRRLENALSEIRKRFPEALLSVDTFRASVAQTMVKDFNVQIINDISSGRLDPLMLETVAKLNVPYCMMHMQGTPQTMQQNIQYDNLMKDILLFFAKRIENARAAGIQDIIIDPGFGFSKTLEQNYTLLKQLSEFKILELPILVGLSRKSMLYKTLSANPEDALAATISANTLALLNGADILRVHDVKQAVDTIKIVEAYKNSYL